MFDLYREINCPLLLFNAVDPLAIAQRRSGFLGLSN
jgi:hypothetical protein